MNYPTREQFREAYSKKAEAELNRLNQLRKRILDFNDKVFPRVKEAFWNFISLELAECRIDRGWPEGTESYRLRFMAMVPPYMMGFFEKDTGWIQQLVVDTEWNGITVGFSEQEDPNEALVIAAFMAANSKCEKYPNYDEFVKSHDRRGKYFGFEVELY